MNRRLPLTTPVIWYPPPLPLTSRLPSVCVRRKAPHSSELHAPFTFRAGVSFWASSHALPSTSTLAAVTEVEKEMRSNSNVSANVSCFIRDVLLILLLFLLLCVGPEARDLIKLFRIPDQIGNRHLSSCKLTDLPLVLATGQFFYHLTQFLWPICSQAGYYSIE